MRVRAALRSLRKSPGFVLAFVLTLGLGIGANTAIFSVINGVLLRPLPYPEADRIMHLRQAAVRDGIPDMSFSFEEVADYRAQAKTIDEFVEFGDWTFNVLGRGEPHRATGGLVTPNFFKILGMRPIVGRMLVPDDQAKGAPPVVVLTNGYWQRVFGSDPSAVGQTLDLTVKKATIVGVLAPGAHYATQRKQDFYVNYAANDHYMSASMQNERTHRMTDVYARLAPGGTVESAQAELREIAARLHRAYPASYPAESGIETVVTPWKVELTEKARPTLLILLGTTIFVLIIACANVANLTLSRLVQRERELAIRAALGASRASLRGELLTENLLLALAGGALGVGLAIAGLNLLVSYTSRFTTRTGEIEVDGWVLALTVALSVGAALLFAWAPRLPFAADPVRSMAGAGGRATAGTGRRRAQRALVVSQLAVSFMLIIGAGLLIRSLAGLYAVDPGFSLSNVLSLQAPNFARLTPAAQQQFTRTLIDQVRQSHGVQNAAAAATAPLADGAFEARRELRVDGSDAAASAAAPVMVTRQVSAGYFETIGARLEAGRGFAPTDTATSPAVAILSASMARFYFKTENPIGHHIALKLFNGTWGQPIEVVGVAADTHADGIDRGPVHTLYQPDTQTFAPSTLLVRTAGSAAALTPQIVETIRGLDPNRPIDHVRTLEEIREDTLAPQRLNATLIGLFSALALLIATVGVAGVLAFSVTQRTNELGIRLALGAERQAILRMILGEGAMMALVGLVVGGAAAIPLSKLMSGLLFGVTPLDPATIAGAAVLMMVVALTAAWIPARRATAVDPMIALRGE